MDRRDAGRRSEGARVLVVGTGHIATTRHLPAWRRFPRAEIVGVCDLDRGAAERAARSFGVAHASDDLSSAIEACAPDIVDLCTPPGTHPQLGGTALEAGCHVVVEKPLALTAREGNALARLARERDRKLCTIHNMLFYPPVLRALELVRDGGIGTFQGMRLLIANPVGRYQGHDGWFHRLPGGLIGETGPHVVYLSRAFVGEIVEVAAHRVRHTPFPWSRGDDFAIQLVGTRGISSVRVVHSSDHWAGDLEVWGSRGRLKIDLQAMTLRRVRRRSLEHHVVAASALREAIDGAAATLAVAGRVLTGAFTRAHERILEAFLDSVLDGTVEPVPVAEAAATVRDLERVVAALSETGGERPA